MGHYKNKLHDILGALDELKHKSEDKSDIGKIKSQELYNQIHHVLSDHIESELKEEEDLVALMNSLISYRKHLKFAQIVVDKDFSLDQSQAHKIGLSTSKKEKNVAQDVNNAKTQINLALKELISIKASFKKVLDQSKLKLE